MVHHHMERPGEPTPGELEEVLGTEKPRAQGLGNKLGGEGLGCGQTHKHPLSVFVASGQTRAWRTKELFFR